MSVEGRVAAESPKTQTAPVRLLGLITVDSHVGLQAVMAQERLQKTPKLQNYDGLAKCRIIKSSPTKTTFLLRQSYVQEISQRTIRTTIV